VARRDALSESPDSSPSPQRDSSTSPLPKRPVGVSFSADEKPKKELSALEQVALRYAEARKKMMEEEKKNAAGASSSTVMASKNYKSFGTRDDSGFSTPAQWRSLDDVKMIPKRGRSHSPSRHASGARTAESVSLATTALTVRSAAMIREDRAFKQDGHFKLNEKPVEVAARLDLLPLDHGRGQQGVGTESSLAWKSKLREIAPTGSKGDPVANNALSRNGVCGGMAPGFFAQVPERLGRWRDDFGRLDSTGAESAGGRVGQWVPEAVLVKRERELRAREAKIESDRRKAEQEVRRHAELEKARREREAEERRAEAVAELEVQKQKRVAEQLEAEKKRLRAEMRKARAEAAERLSGGKR